MRRWRWSATRRRGVDVASTAFEPRHGVCGDVLPENPGRSRGETIDLSAAVYKSVRSHLKAIALLQTEPGGSCAQHESMAAGGYCSKKDCKAQHGSVTCYKPMRMPQSDSARVSANPAELAYAREPYFDSRLDLRLFGHDSLRKRPQSGGIGVRLSVAGHHGPIDSFLELSTF